MNERSDLPAVRSVITEIAGVHNVPHSQSVRMSDYEKNKTRRRCPACFRGSVYAFYLADSVCILTLNGEANSQSSCLTDRTEFEIDLTRPMKQQLEDSLRVARKPWH